ncbi:Uncharacterised protein [Raoultella terrigena]|uniref:Uncharacterized protein n=1 Tax=Raoultella terrigena TaxID=577 RepID=A0A7Z9CQN3_RAOTE|nr:Uncharacterised protein [Raoultella terrigena]
MQRPDDHFPADPGAIKHVRQLRRAACLAMRQPLAGARPAIGQIANHAIRQGALGLESEDQHRHAKLLHQRQHRRAQGVGADGDHDDVRGKLPEAPGQRIAFLQRIDQPTVDDIDRRRAELPFNLLQIAQQALLKAAELWPVGIEPDTK